MEHVRDIARHALFNKEEEEEEERKEAGMYQVCGRQALGAQ